jgi:hypothetical protein
MSEGEDPPIIVVGGPQMIDVEIRRSSGRSSALPEKFSVAPHDPAVPFKTIVITDGAEEVFRWPLSEDWKITIV